MRKTNDRRDTMNRLTVLVVVLGAPNSRVHVLCNAGLYVPFDQARPRPDGIDLDPPSLVHLCSRPIPGISVEHSIQPPDDDDAVGGSDDDRVGHWVFERVVKGRGIDVRGITVQAHDEVDVGGSVERPVAPTSVVCAFGVTHGVELGAGEVPAVEPDEDRLGLGWVGAEEDVDLVDEAGGEGGFPGGRDACDGDQETGCIGSAVEY